MMTLVTLLQMLDNRGASRGAFKDSRALIVSLVVAVDLNSTLILMTLVEEEEVASPS